MNMHISDLFMLLFRARNFEVNLYFISSVFFRHDDAFTYIIVRETKTEGRESVENVGQNRRSG